jgi:hypothetical protein
LNADDALANPDVIEMVARAIVANDWPILVYGDCNVLDRCSGEVLHCVNDVVSRKELLLGQMIRHLSTPT